jgi:Outer membrane protein beta-barrel domain
MNKDLHDIDELFRSALDGHEEIPSAAVKSSLDAALDKKDAESYKKRFIGWKRTALLLLLLLAGFALYELVILKQEADHSGQAVADQKPDAVPAEKQRGANLKNPNADNTIDIAKSNEPDQSDRKTVFGKVGNPENAGSLNHNIQDKPGQRDITAPGTIEISTKNGSKKIYPGNKIAEQNKEAVNDQSNLLTGNTIDNGPIAGKQMKWLERNDVILPKEKINPVALREINPGQQKLSIMNDFILKTSKTSPKKDKRTQSFKPFWILAPFASTERAGYRLDSDLPENITGIKHREAHEPSFSTGFLLTRQLKNGWGLQTGLIYSNTQIGISPQKMYALRNDGDIAYKYITSSGFAYIKPGFGNPPAIGDSLSAAEAKHTLQYISVPVVIKYSAGKKKLSVSPGVGVEGNFLSGAKVETEIKDASNLETVTINKLNGTRSFYWSVIADLELQYKVSKKVSIGFRPAFRYALSPITKNNVVETFPYSLGLGLSMKIKL